MKWKWIKMIVIWTAVHIWFIPYIIHTHFFHGNIWTHNWLTRSQRQWPHSSVGRASHRYREVTGSNPVQVLIFFSCFFTQFHKLRSLRRSFLHFHFLIVRKSSIAPGYHKSALEKPCSRWYMSLSKMSPTPSLLSPLSKVLGKNKPPGGLIADLRTTERPLSVSEDIVQGTPRKYRHFIGAPYYRD